MGQQCLQKSKDMLSSLLITAHTQSQKLYHSIQKRREYSYRSAPLNEHEYENDILLEEDDDNAFDYEETQVPKLLTEEDLKKMKQSEKKNSETQQEGLLDIPSVQVITDQKESEDVALVVNEIEKNIYYEDSTTRDNSYKQ